MFPYLILLHCLTFNHYYQFLNKLRYAKEGARDIIDITCVDLPWQEWLEVDRRNIEIPKVKYLF